MVLSNSCSNESISAPRLVEKENVQEPSMEIMVNKSRFIFNSNWLASCRDVQS